MRKLFTFLLSAVLLALGNLGVNAQVVETWVRPFISTDFNGLTALPEGFTSVSGSSTGTSSSINWVNTASGYLDNGVYRAVFEGNNSGTRTGALRFTDPTDFLAESNNSKIEVIELDLRVDYANFQEQSAMGFHFISGIEMIGSLYLTGDDGYWHLSNKDLTKTVFTMGAGPDFQLGDANMENNITNNASTRIGEAEGFRFVQNVWYSLAVEFDFSTQQIKKLTLKYREDNDPEEVESSAQVVVENLGFVTEEEVGMVDLFSWHQNRPGGLSTGYNVAFDNIKIGARLASLGLGDVVVSYLDEDGNTIKPQNTYAGEQAGWEFILSTDETISFIDNGNYYAFDINQSTYKGTVENDGQLALDLVFKTTPDLSGKTFIWTGENSNIWSELEENFAVDGQTVAYQSGNDVIFPEDAQTKDTIVVVATNRAGSVEMYDANINITGSGYRFTYDNSNEELPFLKIFGEGTIDISADDVSFGVKTEKELYYDGTSLIIGDQDAATTIFLMGECTFEYTGPGTLAIPITAATSFPFNLVPTANVAYNSALSGFSQINIELVSPGWQYFGGTRQTPTLNFYYVDELDQAQAGYNVPVVVTTALDSAHFATTNNFLSSLHLGKGVIYIYGGGTLQPNAEDFAVTIAKLTGEAGSRLASSHIFRAINWTIGSSNESSVFEGDLRPYLGGDTWGTTAKCYITKVGTGDLELSGNLYPSSTLIVSEGRILLSGKLEAGFETDLEKTEIDENGYSVKDEDNTYIPSFTVKQIETFTLALDSAAYIIGKNGGRIRNMAAIETLEGSLFGGDLEISDVSDINIYGGDIEMNMRSFRKGAYDIFKTGEGVNVFGYGNLYVNVNNQTDEDGIATLFDIAQGDIEFDAIIVNGKDITDNTEANISMGDYFYVSRSTPSDIFGYNIPAYSLVQIINGNSIEADKVEEEPIASEYYDITGNKVSKETTGFVIIKNTYADGSVKTEKRYIK